ncbi:hypothetical protein PPL_11328 [Heterostelium album PN500]|uniref:Uncharacterized protein n=1 Tax=Heterostelium pallidum (strain ATCC 26659 / Pp 5 / PN500) TaxID=670386 RepID=D3BT36_HETP5|nr:hypothetical protein PPL_11328 [Heterostelium album PN500]EFA75253.1 hypothetical protein PPL_11328 [Heterostelium album PN500]|eukprot:XP_020427387.1 hypothetical protein PPL_11328 [Heterostelium album PN500]
MQKLNHNPNDEEICSLMLINLKELSSYHIVPTLSQNNVLPSIELLTKETKNNNHHQSSYLKELPKYCIPSNPLFIECHWELLSLDKKKCDNWHKQIQDMLSHSKTTFESGSGSLGQNGFWKLRDGKIDPWLEGVDNGNRFHVPSLSSSQSRMHPYTRGSSSSSTSPKKNSANHYDIEQQLPIILTPKSFNMSIIN